MTSEPQDKDRVLIDALIAVLGDRYEFVSRLGAGAFGEVYCLHDTVLERDVAVKRVRLDAFADEVQRDELRERTIREAKVAAKLKHPHIVTIYDVVDRPDMSFIIMEYIEGQTLAKLLKEKGRLSLDETVRLMGQTASALDFAHAKGIVHRDIKPANIMVESSGNVKVTDFGIAKSDAFTELTAAGSVLGTPNYMSPEQARGESTINKSADLFSLGCVVYECLVGKKAFVGKTVMATLLTIMNEGPRPVEYEALGLQGSISEVMNKALAKDPQVRFATAGEFISAFASLPTPQQATVVLPPPEPPPEASRPAAQVVTRREPGVKSSFDAELQGSLSETTVAELIREVYSARNTGILHFERSGVAKRIYFKKGNVVFANSDLNEDRLGELLIRTNVIDRATFDQVSAAMTASGKRLGATLIEMEALSRDKLKEIVRDQVQEIIYSVFEWEDGAYGLELLERPVEEDIIVDLSTAELILIGVRRMGSFGPIRNALGSLDRVLRHTENPLLLYQKMTLTTSEGYVLSRVDGATSIADIASISPLGEDETLRCVYALVAAGVVELTAKGSTPTSRIQVAADREETAPRPEAKSMAGSGSGRELPAREQEATGGSRKAERAVLEDIASKHASLETADYYELLEVSPGASDEEIKKGYYAMARKYHPDRHHQPHLHDVHGLLEELFAKITFAYQELSDPGSRRRYDGARQQRKQQEASESRSSESVQTPAPYTVPPEVMAERRYQQGLKHFEHMEYFDAIQCLRDSVRMMPADARFHKLLARALAKNPHWRKEAEFHFNEALKANEFDLECLLGLAETYDAANLKTRAAKVYERILAYDPDNAVASERLHGKSKRPKGKG